jgi:hypothetical protein
MKGWHNLTRLILKRGTFATFERVLMSKPWEAYAVPGAGSCQSPPPLLPLGEPYWSFTQVPSISLQTHVIFPHRYFAIGTNIIISNGRGSAACAPRYCLYHTVCTQ